MIVYFPFLLFAAGTLVAYGSTGLRRQAATIATVAASGWSLVLLVDPGSGTWAIGPVVATLLLPRAGQRAQSNFEGLTRRAVTLTVAVLVALFLATRLPVGENPILLSVVPWLMGALGAAWLTSPTDEPERLQGQALLVAAAAVLILVAVPAGPLTAGVAGAMALVPIAGERGRISLQIEHLAEHPVGMENEAGFIDRDRPHGHIRHHLLEPLVEDVFILALERDPSRLRGTYFERADVDSLHERPGEQQ